MISDKPTGEQSFLPVSTVEEPAIHELSTVTENADEESPSDGQRIVEPELVLSNDSQKASPPKSFLSRGLSRGALARLPSTVININQLPQDVANNLRPYDINGDGMISLTELVHGALTQNEQQEKVC